MKPLIGITCGTFRDREWCPPIHGHRQTYIDSVVAAGGAPFLFPLVDDQAVVRALYERLDGVLLAGGCDVDPSYYGEEPMQQLGPVDVLRDRVEMWLARWAAEEGKPVLGICRGMQVLNVALGGSLYQDIPTQLQPQYVHDGSYACEDWTHMVHDIRIEPSSKIAKVFDTSAFPINSLHHQSLKVIAPQLKPVGWAPDGVVELVEGSNGHFMVGVQCHPEALQAEADPRWRRLFKHFVDQCQA
ncbi:MAG TPA: gamma-glutamyl-gamma-aminobutyrate hydrolase family protein [Herpetosiphonaceae bacterium]